MAIFEKKSILSKKIVQGVSVLYQDIILLIVNIGDATMIEDKSQKRCHDLKSMHAK